MVLDYDGSAGRLTERQTVSTLPEGFDGPTTAGDIEIHANGRFAYASNRGHDSIVTFRIDPATGQLECLGHQSCGGKTPRNLAFDPEGRFLLAANQDSDNVVVFAFDPERGGLDFRSECAAPMPTCVKFRC